ncbi:Adventurous-gliding motility protein Z [Bienertia sinuspersici]
MHTELGLVVGGLRQGAVVGGLAGAGVGGWWAREGGAVQWGFRHEFSWDPSIASLVKKEWQSKCARHLSGIVSKVSTDPSYDATWCAPALRAHMKKIRQEGEDFKRRSSQCSKNSCGMKVKGFTFVKEKELDRLPTAPELYYDGHVDDDGKFVNPKAEQVMSFRRRKLPTSNVKMKHLFFEVVGGWNEKGRIFGLGAAAHSYYDRPTYEEKNGKKSRREYIKSLETQTKQELGETKQGLVETQTNLYRTQKVLIETKKTLVETTESFMTFKQEVEKFMQANPSRSLYQRCI